MSDARPTAAIAEDEPVLRDGLKQALAGLWPELEILAEAADGLQALQALDAHDLDVMFLDIEMPGLTGLQVARQVEGRCHVVFVTAFDSHAVQAFEEGAVDYVLKPLSLERLATTVTRLKQRLGSAPARLDGLFDRLAGGAAHEPLRWIVASQGEHIRLITLDEVCYFQSDNKYTRVVTPASESLIRTPLRELIPRLDRQVFWQVHRGTVVNANAIADVRRNGGQLTLRLKQRAEQLSVSESYLRQFRQM